MKSTSEMYRSMPGRFLIIQKTSVRSTWAPLCKNTLNSTELVSEGKDVCVCESVMRSICLSNFVILARAALRSPVKKWLCHASSGVLVLKKTAKFISIHGQHWGNDTSDFADVEAVKAATNLKLQLEATARKATWYNLGVSLEWWKGTTTPKWL